MPENDNLNNLTRGATEGIPDDGRSIQKLENMKRFIRDICNSLTFPTASYDSDGTLNIISIFISSENGVFRILYSEIHNHLMALDDEKKGAFYSNIDKLLERALNGEFNGDVVKIVLKIYDHVQLVNSQIVSVENAVIPHIDSVKSNFHNEIKIVEREYITILGIFAAIVLAFVGTFTFSTSALNNVGTTPFVKIFLISCVIGVVFYSIVSLLLNFLRDINEKPHSKTNYKCGILISLIFGIILGIIFKDNIVNVILQCLH